MLLMIMMMMRGEDGSEDTGVHFVSGVGESVFRGKEERKRAKEMKDPEGKICSSKEKSSKEERGEEEGVRKLMVGRDEEGEIWKAFTDGRVSVRVGIREEIGGCVRDVMGKRGRRERRRRRRRRRIRGRRKWKKRRRRM